jgi:hypothetical protein
MSSSKSSEQPERVEQSQTQTPGDAAPPSEPNAQPITPPGYDNTILQYEPERHVPQGGETESPALADILAETDTLTETTYPDTTGTLIETEWAGQGGQLDNTVGESRIGLDQTASQHDDQASPHTGGDTTSAPDAPRNP